MATASAGKGQSTMARKDEANPCPSSEEEMEGKPVTVDPSSLLPVSNKSPAAQPDRLAANAALDALLRDTLRPSPCDVHGSGPLLLSDIPICIKENKERGVVLGIDEAGRGPVLGPMTYAAAFWSPDSAGDIPSGFNDSKQLSPEKRASLFEKIKSSESIGFVLRVLHASEISRNMLRKVPYNLNAMSHDAAMEMIWAVLDAGVKIDTWYVGLKSTRDWCRLLWLFELLDLFMYTQARSHRIIHHSYVDTVGSPDIYRKKLERVFQGKDIKFIVEKKADAKYAPCSAASVGKYIQCSSVHWPFVEREVNVLCCPRITVAKESRDTMIANWKWTETPGYESQNSTGFGSGYPSDPKCKEWLDSNCNVDMPFGFPDFVRFSWGPSKNALKEGAENCGPVVRWEADEDEEDDSGGKQSRLDAFVVGKKAEGKARNPGNLEELQRKRARPGIFNEMGLSKVTKFVEVAH
ncbi:hypothetical protein ACHAWF_006367 [Thalassiosira exigua]